MKKAIHILVICLVLIAVFLIGYVTGSVRGARIEFLYGQILRLSYAHGIIEAIRKGESEIVLPDSHLIASSLYRSVTEDPWYKEKLIFPVFTWYDNEEYPTASYGVNDAAHGLVANAGNCLIEYNKQSNDSHSANPAPQGSR